MAPLRTENARVKGRTEKRSISFDPELVAELEQLADVSDQLRELTDNLSRVVNDAVRSWVKARRLEAQLDQMDDELGPVPERLLAEVERELGSNA